MVTNDYKNKEGFNDRSCLTTTNYLLSSLPYFLSSLGSVAQCQRMFKEIQEGERQLTETENDVKSLRASLGLGGEILSPQQEAPKSKTRKGTKVGKRKPKRDSVGLEQDVS